MTNPLTPDQRLAKADKVRALRAKTVANGCTADEADAAQAMADRLCAQYDLSASATAPQPAGRRATSTADQAMADFLRDVRREGQADRVAQAQAAYRRNGTHAGPAPYYSDCRCMACAIVRVNANNASAKRAGQAFRDMGAHTTQGPRARRNGSHANCTHEATSSARARCRNARQG